MTENSQDIEVFVQDGIGLIRLNRREKRNALDAEMMQALSSGMIP